MFTLGLDKRSSAYILVWYKLSFELFNCVRCCSFDWHMVNLIGNASGAANLQFSGSPFFTSPGPGTRLAPQVSQNLCDPRQLYQLTAIGSLRYGDYGLRTTAGRVLSLVCSTGLSRANIER